MDIAFNYSFNINGQRWETGLTWTKDEKTRGSFAYVKPENFNPEFVLGGLQKMVKSLDEDLKKYEIQ